MSWSWLGFPIGSTPPFVALVPGEPGGEPFPSGYWHRQAIIGQVAAIYEASRHLSAGSERMNTGDGRATFTATRTLLGFLFSKQPLPDVLRHGQ